MVKQCCKCKELKDLGDFCNRKSSRDGLNNQCRGCDKKYKQDRKEHIAKQDKAYYENNKEDICERAKKYRGANRENIKYRLANLVSSANLRAKKKNLKISVDTSFLLSLWEKQSAKCAISGEEMRLDHTHLCLTVSNSPSLDRINSELGYTQDNVQLICSWANSMKGSFTMEEFKNKCKILIG